MTVSATVVGPRFQIWRETLYAGLPLEERSRRVSHVPVGIVTPRTWSTYQHAVSPVFNVMVFTGPAPFVQLATLLYVQAFSVAWFVSRREKTPFPETSSTTGGSGELLVFGPWPPRVLAASEMSAMPDQSAVTATNCVPLSDAPANVAPTSIWSTPTPASATASRTQAVPMMRYAIASLRRPPRPRTSIRRSAETPSISYPPEVAESVSTENRT